MFLILGCFTICWLPYFVLVIFIRIYKAVPVSLYESAFTLAMSNSAINPLIYAWKNKAIRKAFIRLLQCQTPNFNDSPNFVGSRKELKPSPFAIDGICITKERCILQSEIEMVDKKTYANKSKKCQEDVLCINKKKDILINTVKETNIETKPEK